MKPRSIVGPLVRNFLSNDRFFEEKSDTSTLGRGSSLCKNLLILYTISKYNRNSLNSSRLSGKISVQKNSHIRQETGMEKLSGFLGKLCRSVVVAAIIFAVISGIVRYFTDNTHSVVQKTAAAIVSLGGTISLLIALYFEDRARRKRI
jgi:hypothetical protein